MLVHNGEYILPEVLQTILPYGPLAVSEGPSGYWVRRGFTQSTDRTNEILEEYKNYGQGIVGIVHGQWADKTDEINASIHLVPSDTEFIWECDSDEIYHPRDIERILQILDSGLYDSVSFRMISFYGGFDRYMLGFERQFEVQRIKRFYPGARWLTHRPPTILNPQTRRPWREHRHLGCVDTDAMELWMRHYSYVFPRQMKEKADYYYDYNPSREIPNYFKEVYLPWVLGNDAQRQMIEDKWDGVHDWKPSARGPCRTAKFTGQHPPAIANAMPRLLEEFNQQLAYYVKCMEFGDLGA